MGERTWVGFAIGVAVAAGCSSSGGEGSGSASPKPEQCAAQGVNCTAGYLRVQNLDGCCDGLVCKLTDAGIRTCETATSDEIELAQQCEAAPINSVIQALDPVTTSAGSMPLTDVSVEAPASGPGGCLTSFQISFGTCRLDAQVSAPGSFSVSGSNCGLSLGGSLSGTATFTGISCDGGLIFETYCYAGTITLTLGGAPTRLTGTFCTVQRPSVTTCSG